MSSTCFEGVMGCVSDGWDVREWVFMSEWTVI